MARKRRAGPVRACILTGDGEIITPNVMQRMGLAVIAKTLDKPAELKIDTTKALRGVPVPGGQNSAEIQDGDAEFGALPVISPPTPFDLLVDTLHSATTHNAAVETKASDYAYHGWKLIEVPEAKDGGIDDKELAEARAYVERFLSQAVDGMFPIEDACHDIALDFESLGSGGPEILREEETGFICGVNHIPMHTMRVLHNAVKQKEMCAHYVQRRYNKTRYFVPFNYNIEYKNPKFDPMRARVKDFPSFKERAKFISIAADRLIDRDTPDESAGSWENAATEFFMLSRPPRMRSTVYGTPSGIAAYTSILGEMKAELYNLQFFNSKGVPQYAITIEGSVTGDGPSNADEDDGYDPMAMYRETIREYFQKHLQTADRNVLVLETEAGVKIAFHRLSPEAIDDTILKYKNDCRESIRLAHRVPPAALGIVETANLGSGRDSAQLTRYRNHIVTPGQRTFAAMVNMIIRCGLLIPYFRFAFNLMPVEDEGTMRKFKLEEYKEGGITPNEYRAETGRSPFTGEDNDTGIGDALLIRNAQMSIVDPDKGLQTTMPGQSPNDQPAPAIAPAGNAGTDSPSQ